MLQKLAAVLVIAIASGFLFVPTPAHAGGGGGGCRGEAMTDARGTAVGMENSCFLPTILRVEAGDAVTFANRDPGAHMVTGAANSWGEYEELYQGDSVVYSFDESGVYPYFCLLHPGMVGAIVVGDGTSSSTGSVSGDDSAVSAVPPMAEGQSASSEAPPSDSSGGAGTYLLVIGVTLLAGTVGLSVGLIARHGGLRGRNTSG